MVRALFHVRCGFYVARLGIKVNAYIGGMVFIEEAAKPNLVLIRNIMNVFPHIWGQGCSFSHLVLGARYLLRQMPLFGPSFCNIFAKTHH